MGSKSSDVKFDFGPLLDGQMMIAKLKSSYYLLIIGPRIWDVKLTYRKLWGRRLLMWSDLTLDTFFKVKQG